MMVSISCICHLAMGKRVGGPRLPFGDAVPQKEMMKKPGLAVKKQGKLNPRKACSLILKILECFYELT